jgi:hypothetical protein
MAEKFANDSDLQSHLKQDWRVAHSIVDNVKAMIPSYVAEAAPVAISTTNNGAWHTVDLSAYLPANVFKAQLLIVASDSDVNLCYFRAHGNTAGSGQTRFECWPDTGKMAYISGEADCPMVDQFLEYKIVVGSPAVYLIGYWKLTSTVTAGTVGGGGAPGVSYFTSLLDAFPSYAALGSRYLRVNSGETGVEAGAAITVSAAAPSGGADGDVWIQYDALPSVAAHQLDSAAFHTVSGLTPGHFLKATGAGSFGFAAHGLDAAAVGAAAAGHNHAGVYDVAGAAAAVTPTTLGLVIGTNVQAYNSNLTGINQALDTTASPSWVTGKFTALSDGYVPYHVSDAAGLADSKIFQTGGNVGIGTTGPGTKLDVYDTAGTAGAVTDVLTLSEYQSTVAGNNAVGLLFKTRSNSGLIPMGRIYGDLTDGSGSPNEKGALRFSTKTAGTSDPTVKMSILDNGNVLIGATAAVGSEELLVQSAAVSNDLHGITIKNASTGGYGSRLTFAGGYDGGYAFAALETENNGTGGDLRFYTADSGHALTQRMVIRSGGFVGIGCTPTMLFEVSKSLDTNWLARFCNPMATAGHNYGPLIEAGTSVNDYCLACYDGPETYQTFVVRGNGDVYIKAECSALSYVDRTPYPKDTAEAWAAIKSMKHNGKGGVDHAALHPFVKSEYMRADPILKTETLELGRNLSASLSAAIATIQDLEARILKLETTH